MPPLDDHPMTASGVEAGPLPLHRAATSPGRSTPERAEQGILSRVRALLAPAWYGLIALAVLFPLLREGYLLLLDWTPAPMVGWSVEGPLGVQEAPARALLLGLNVLLPGWLIQRVILFAVLWGAGWAAHATAPVKRDSARFFAGTLYALTPFVFSRLMAGHWRLLIVYALAPLALRAILRLADQPEARRGVHAGLWIAGLGAVSPHATLLLIPLLIAAAVALVSGSAPRRNVASGFGASLLVVALGVLWWVVPAVLHGYPGASDQALSTFGSRSIPGESLTLTLLSLRGFWVANFDTVSFGWALLAIGIVALSLFGMAVAVRGPRRRWVVIMLATGLIAVLLAMGTASTLTAPITHAFYRVLPGFDAFREPQKLLILLAVAYAWFGAAAIDWLAARSHRLVRSVAVVALAIPLLQTPHMFAALGGRLDPVHYPASWYEADRTLRADPDRFSTLVLPWKLYLTLPFNSSSGPVANPAADFFSVPTISSKDPQVGPEEAEGGRTATRIGSLIERHEVIDRLGAAVAPLDVKYLALIPSADPRAYSFLYRQRDLDVVLKSPDMVLFRNTAWSPSGEPSRLSTEASTRRATEPDAAPIGGGKS